jgi:uncharacterized protein (TIGR02118 family)
MVHVFITGLAIALVQARVIYTNFLPPLFNKKVNPIPLQTITQNCFQHLLGGLKTDDMYKVTVLYKYTDDVEKFERYYQEKHLPLARLMPNLSRLELTRFEAGPDMGKPEYCRMAEIYFSSHAVMEESMGSHESQTAIDDLANFAINGVTILMGSVDEE